jgi:hypothetical protein
MEPKGPPRDEDTSRDPQIEAAFARMVQRNSSPSSSAPPRCFQLTGLQHYEPG